ncbi:acyltransferase [Bradyrhizobium sp. LVM 105]|uniref:acyltransferase family protein n=1 Tax=Bradyrhizobium sp. LVM 105 TaxID=2341115 RepID=UPI0024BFE770|nr:acyltransferase [Bradyrhizobium sp. LVM 105]
MGTLQNDRSIGIDCLRAIAILWVVAYHFVPLSIFSKGTYGVLLFFAVSGYCISFSASSSKSAWDFYAKRLGRLLPALIFATLLITAIKHLFPQFIEANRIPTWFHAFYTLFALPTLHILKINLIYPDGAFWSLDIEFQFYLLCALLIAVGLRKYLLPAICIWCLIRFALSSPKNPYSNDFFAFFIAGLSVASYAAGHRMQALFGTAVALFLEAGHLLLSYQQPSVPIETSRFAMLAFSIAAVFVAAQCKAPRFLNPLAFVGLVSYPLYLLHQDLGHMALAWLDVPYSDRLVPTLIRALIVPPILVGVGALVYFYVEKPLTGRLTGWLRRPRFPKSVWIRTAGVSPDDQPQIAERDLEQQRV